MHRRWYIQSIKIYKKQIILVVILDITTKIYYYSCNNSYYNSLIKENILIQKRRIKMKIAIIAANGRAGKLIMNEALERGLDVI